jgi:CubicO group peptidase (beta-lactamase class C family)
MKFLTCILLSISVAGLVTAQTKKDPFPARMDSLFASFNTKTSPGLAAGIIKDGRVIFTKGYGMANLEYDIPNSSSSVFDIASVSKQFAGLAISMLIQEGKVALQDDIHKYVPELPDFGKVITIEHLLHHTSGLRDWPEGLNVAGWRWNEDFSWADILRMAQHQKELDFAPGEKYSYSNTGYNMLALTVERVSGMTFRAWTDKYIFKPLLMNNSRFQDDASELTKNMAYSYSRNDGVFKKNLTGLTAVGSSSLFTNVDDLCKWVIHFNKQLAAKDPVYVRMIEPGKLNDGKKVDYGFGLGLGNLNGLTTITHTGGWAGYRTIIMNIPDEKVSIILLGNSSEFNPSSNASAVASLLLKNKMKFTPNPVDNAQSLTTVKLSEAAMKKVEGTYQLAEEWFVTFTQENNQLMVQANGEPKFLTSPKSDSVIWVDAYGASVTFVKDSGGKYGSLRYRGFNAPKLTPTMHDPAEDQKLVGTYYSEEFATEYKVSMKDGKLSMFHMRHGNLDVTPDPIVAGKYLTSIGSLKVFRDSNNEIAGFRLSRGRIKNIKFDKRK